MAKDRVIFFCAHPDDESLGAGGTIAKYVKEGKQVMVVSFTYAVLSHTWLKKHVTRDMRKKELENAQKVLGFQKHLYLELSESKFLEEAKEKNIQNEIIRMITKFKPSKIFTHAPEDRDPISDDHRAVNKIVMEAVEAMGYKGDVYGFGVWNPFSFKRTDYPKLYVDITDTFKIKLEALRNYPSQWSSMILLLWTVYARAILAGIAYGVKFAERFYKLK